MAVENTKHNRWAVVAVVVLCMLSYIPVYAISYKEVTMSVGETKTLYLPSSVTSKDLKSVTFYSNGISYVQVTSYNNYSVTVKAVKAFSSPIIVRCDYRYFVRSGSFTYEASGAYDYRITVVGSGSGGVEPTSISFPSTIKCIDVGESLQLTPTVLPKNAEYTLTWSIVDTSVATISQDGLLVGKSAGATDLKVKADNGVYTMLRVVVSEPTAYKVTVSPSSVTLNEGAYKYLSAQVYPSGASQSVTWSSSNSSVATVSSSGRVVAIKPGTATITATTSNGVKGTCEVTCKSSTPDIELSDKNGYLNIPSVANVKYTRTLYAGWNSMCIPFALTQSMLDAFGEGCKISVADRYEIIGNSHVLAVRQVESVTAGCPCLIYAPCDIVCNFSLDNVSLNPTPINTSILKGAYIRTVIGPNYYKLTDDGERLGITKTEKAVVGPFRVYIELASPSATKAMSRPIEIKLTQIKY